MHYTNYTTPQLQLHYATTTTAAALHHTTSSSCGWGATATIATTPKTQLQPPFSPSVGSLCHPWITTTNLSYMFPILKLPPLPCAVLLVSYMYMCMYHRLLWSYKLPKYGESPAKAVLSHVHRSRKPKGFAKVPCEYNENTFTLLNTVQMKLKWNLDELRWTWMKVDGEKTYGNGKQMKLRLEKKKKKTVSTRNKRT